MGDKIKGIAIIVCFFVLFFCLSELRHIGYSIDCSEVICTSTCKDMTHHMNDPESIFLIVH